MIYAAFAIWFFLIVFMALGVHALWARLVPPRYVAWVLLPGTILAEMAYIFGSLITGGEVRSARILPGGAARRGRAEGDGEPTTDATGGLKVVGPLVAALLAVAACLGGIVIAHGLLGEPVLSAFATRGLLTGSLLPQELPGSMGEFWDLLRAQPTLLQRITETFADVRWLNWRVPLFVYLTICFTVRLAPGRKDMRYTLAAVVILAGLIALAGVVSTRFTDLIQDIWPLLTYVWALLLLLLALTLLIHGAIALGRVLAGK